MKQVVVLSGKGGTGKTSLTAALAHLASDRHSTVLVDADVDAANLDLLLKPLREADNVFMGGQVALIDPLSCTGCGRCEEVCRFGAVEVGTPPARRIDPVSCEGCASCFHQCPVTAIEMEKRQAGNWFRSSTRFGMLFHAHLNAGQENSGKLVTTVKKAALHFAGEQHSDLILVDGPPGIGCPVISASVGADLALLVVEPTVSGIHDLERILGTVRHFGITPAVCVNKADINPGHTETVKSFCNTEDIGFLGKIPFDTAVTEAMTHGFTVTENFPESAVSLSMRDMFLRLEDLLFVPQQN